MSAVLSKELDKYEYLTGEYLGYKQGAVEQVQFEYSPLGKVVNKVLKNNDKVNKANIYDNDLSYVLCIILIYIVCLILMKYH